MPKLAETVRLLLTGQKGLLTMDEGTPTCDRRFANECIAQDADTRRAYRELIIATPGLSKYITEAGIAPGIKVDAGATPLAGHGGETVTEGLDGLREYASMRARFAKCRAVFTPGDGLPSRASLDANAHALARYAAPCQESAIVPVVEPEVPMSGDHGMARSAQATETALRRVFEALARRDVAPQAMILKPNMNLLGMDSTEQPLPSEVALATLGVLRGTAPAAVSGVAFLPGSRSGLLASARLNAMNLPDPASTSPWTPTFSFARVIQKPALQVWAGRRANRPDAQRALGGVA